MTNHLVKPPSIKTGLSGGQPSKPLLFKKEKNKQFQNLFFPSPIPRGWNNVAKRMHFKNQALSRSQSVLVIPNSIQICCVIIDKSVSKSDLSQLKINFSNTLLQSYFWQSKACMIVNKCDKIYNRDYGVKFYYNNRSFKFF